MKPVIPSIAEQAGGMPEPVSHRPHDLEGEQRGALDQGEKVFPVDRGQQAIGAGDSRGAARLVVDQGQFAQHAARTDRFKNSVALGNVDFTFGDDVEADARIALAKNGLARRKGLILFDLTKKILVFHKVGCP